MSAETVTNKGQVTIPIEIRQAFDIQAGDTVTFFKGLDGELKVRVGRPRPGAGRASVDGGGVNPTRAAIGEAVADGVADRLARIGAQSGHRR